MKKILLITLTAIFINSNSLAYSNNNWKERFKELEFEFRQMKTEVDLMYRMLSELYIKRMGYKAYEKLVFEEKGVKSAKE